MNHEQRHQLGAHEQRQGRQAHEVRQTAQAHETTHSRGRLDTTGQTKALHPAVAGPLSRASIHTRHLLRLKELDP